MDPQLNPGNWKHSHWAIWAAVCLAGGMVAMMVGYMHSAFSTTPDQGDMVIAWLHYPIGYVPWFIGGALLAGAAFYAADLLTGAR